MSYTEYDSIKIKLRIANDSMRDEIELYMQEIDDLLDNRLRARLGAVNIYGDEIVLPLTSETVPELPLELKGIANNLVVAKIRLQNSEKPMLWDAEVNILDNYLDRVYGYIRGTAFRPRRSILLAPQSGAVAQVVTVTGAGFAPIRNLTIEFISGNTISYSAGTIVTTPTTVITDNKGVFSFTFPIPANTSAGAYKLKVHDNIGGMTPSFQVT
jgi:hypothetical protein